MDNKDWNLWSNITFKTQAYRKNFDLVSDDENIITECDGTISEIRISEQKMPLIVGEYGFSIWNLELGRKLGVNFNKLIKEYSIEDTYNELLKMIKEKHLNINDYKKIVLIHTYILRKDYRKRGITEEFIEFLYRDFYDEKIAIIALVKPFQNNPIDADFYLKRKSVEIKDKLIKPNDKSGFTEIKHVPSVDYYSLNELLEKKDTEINEYKLFSVASKCGFNRIDESHLFFFSPEKIIQRLMDKRKNNKKFNTV